MKTIIPTIFLVLAANSPAFAVDTTVVYKSGIVVSVFVGFLALIVVVQLVPALILLLAFINRWCRVTGKRAQRSNPQRMGINYGKGDFPWVAR